MKFNLSDAISALPETEQEEVRRRVELVHCLQRKYGMEPRDDSQLTLNYARGLLDEEDIPSSIANELVIVDAIHRLTPYPDLIEDVLREIAHHIRAKYRLNWRDTWEIVRFYGPTMLKLYCAKKEPRCFVR